MSQLYPVMHFQIHNSTTSCVHFIFLIQEKMLAEMDEEFGIGNIVEQEFTNKSKVRLVIT